MNKLFLFCILMVGCAPEADRGKVKIQYAASEDQKLTITVLGTNDEISTWKLVELKHNGSKYIYLQNYDHNNQSMVLVERVAD